jgi:hypothetical protein
MYVAFVFTDRLSWEAYETIVISIKDVYQTGYAVLVGTAISIVALVLM